MTFTYTNTPLTSRRDALRLLTFDTDATSVKLQDEQLDYFLGKSANDYLAAAQACLAIAAKAAEDVSASVGTLREEAQQRFDHYRALAESYFWTGQGGAPGGQSGIGTLPLGILPANPLPVDPFFTRTIPE